MKKKPILLSTLTLMAGITGVANMTLPLSPPVLATDIVSENRSVENFYIEDPFEMNAYFGIRDLKFATNMINYKVASESPLNGAKARRVLIVMRDYESGVSEKYADEAVKTLGVGDSAWYIPLIDTTDKLALQNNVKVKNVQLEDNLSDVIYYAIQYGDSVTDENGNTILEGEHWVRGKLDYRQCMHSAMFDVATMACSVRLNYTTQTAKLAVLTNGAYVDLPEGEQVIAWDEEWRAILQQRITNLNTQLTHMNQQLPALKSTLWQATEAIKKLETNVTTVNEAQDLEHGVAQLQELLRNLQSAYGQMTGAEQQKLIDDLRASLDMALIEVEQLKQQLAEVDNTHDQQELEKLRADLQSAQSKLNEVNTQLHDKMVDLETKKSQMSQLQIQIEEILLEKAKIVQDLQFLASDQAVLVVDNEQLKQENTELKAETMQLKQEVAMLRTVQGENEKLRQENDVLRDEKARLQAENGDLVVQIEKLQARIRELEARQAGSSNNTQEKDVIVIREAMTPEVADVAEVPTTSSNTEEVEVPNLGGVETKTNFWWVVAAIVGALGVLVACCRRYVSRER